MGNVFDNREPEENIIVTPELQAQINKAKSGKFDQEYFRHQFFQIANPPRLGGVPLPSVNSLVDHILKADLEQKEKSLKDMITKAPWILDRINDLVYEDLGTTLSPTSETRGNPNHYDMVLESAFRLRFKDKDETENRIGPYTVVVDSRKQADQLLNMLKGLLEHFGLVSIMDVLSSVGRPPTFTDQNWGWNSLDEAEVLEADVHGSTFTFIRFPQPVRINDQH